MAQRTPGSTGRPSGRLPATARTGSGGSRRTRTAPVKKPFPWGFVAGCTVLVLALAGILVFALLNTGSGVTTALDKADARFKGLQVTKNPTFDHVATRVTYPGAATAPPDGGNHNPYPQSCAVYTAPLVNEHAVHSLEHGAVWVTYRPDLPADQVATLKGLVDGNDYRLLSPYPGQTSPVSLQAWGRRLAVPSATDPRVQQFLDRYTNGPQTREKGSSCSGVTEPGTVPFVLSPDQKSFVPGPGAPATGAAPSTAPSP